MKVIQGLAACQTDVEIVSKSLRKLCRECFSRCVRLICCGHFVPLVCALLLLLLHVCICCSHSCFLLSFHVRLRCIYISCACALARRDVRSFIARLCTFMHCSVVFVAGVVQDTRPCSSCPMKCLSCTVQIAQLGSAHQVVLGARIIVWLLKLCID